MTRAKVTPPRKWLYLGGPITGLSADSASQWRDDLVLPEPWIPLSPMRGKKHLTDKFGDAPLPAMFDADDANRAVTRDLSDIRQAQAVLFNFLGAPLVSLGSSAELGYAYALGKPIVVVLDEGPHDHLFVHFMASKVVGTLDEAINVVENESWQRRLAFA